jgi:endonuclease III
MKMVEKLLHLYGESYSQQLGINPKADPFKWLIASVLFGAPIQESVAAKTYTQFEKEHMTTPEGILAIGWDNLVDTLDRGGYVRYDYKTADKLMEMARNVLDKGIPFSQEEVISLAKGIGQVTAAIFLRELNLDNTEYSLQKSVYDAGENLGLIREKTLPELKKVWAENRIKGYTYVNFETALLRLGKNFCRKEKHRTCEMREWCTI